MKIKQDNKTGGADIIFSWKEVWIIIKHRRLRFDEKCFQGFSGALLRMIMDWNLNFSNPDIKQVEKKDIVDPNVKTDK
tara:strand:- start:258 stop:491 length:234 start_codon:yes stop_codon:yes gene_type:complete